VEAKMYLPGRVLKLLSVSALLSTFIFALSGCIESEKDLHSSYTTSDFGKYAKYDGWVFQTEDPETKEIGYLWVSFVKPNKLNLIGIDHDFKASKDKGEYINIRYIADIPGIKNEFLIGVQKERYGYMYFAFRLDDKNTLYAVFAHGKVASVSELVKKVNKNIASKEIMKYTPLGETDRQKVLAKVRAQNPQK
jgi:hypothetical protein